MSIARVVSAFRWISSSRCLLSIPRFVTLALVIAIRCGVLSLNWNFTFSLINSWKRNDWVKHKKVRDFITFDSILGEISMSSGKSQDVIEAGNKTDRFHSRDLICGCGALIVRHFRMFHDFFELDFDRFSVNVRREGQTPSPGRLTKLDPITFTNTKSSS